MLRVADLMTPTPVICRATDFLDEAARLMADHDVGCLPVVDDENHLSGVLTDRDIALTAYAKGEALRAIPVNQAMASRVHACKADDELTTIERIMSERRVRRMPVIDASGFVVGLISLDDLARAAARGKHVTPKEVTATLAAIAREGAIWST